MFCEIRMMLVFVVFATVVCASSAKTVKKIPKDEVFLKSSTEETTKKTAKPITGPAIIAIEIVDPNENKTTKNSKRTIDSSLGYGYQNSFGATNNPKLEFYKYSQHDIPPYRGPTKNLFVVSQGQDYGAQNTVQYSLGGQNVRAKTPVYKTAYPKVPQKTLANYYRPGTTLYSTLDQQGQIGDLSQTPQHYQDQNAPVPVILLKVYPSQLANPTGLYPNLPQSHPYADDLNSIDIQSLLTKYLQNILTQQPLSAGHVYPQQNVEGQHQQHLYQPVMYQQPQYQYIQMPIMSVLPTYENYPDAAHTRVIFHHENGHIPPKDAHIPQKTITVQLPHNYDQIYSNVQVQTHDTQYSYGTNPQNGGGQTAYYYQPQNQIQETQHYFYPSPQEEEYETTPYQEPTDTTQAPFNYHAHPRNEKSRRNRKARARTTTNSKTKREKRQE